MDTTGYIERLLFVASVANDMDALLDKLHGNDVGLGYDYSEPNIRKRIEASNEGDRALSKYIAELPLEHLERIHALMYAGRDRESPSDLKQSFVTRGIARADMERSVAEKRLNLRTYFENALAQTNVHGVDPNTF